MNKYNAQNPFSARLIRRTLLSKHNDRKTFHLVFDIKNSNFSFRPGDAAGIFPKNRTGLVHKTLLAMNAPDTFFETLKEKLSITRLSSGLVALKPQLKSLLLDKQLLDQFVATHEVWDFLEEYKEPVVYPEQVLAQLFPMPPRFYSIASSMHFSSSLLHLLVSTLTYETRGTTRFGVASHYLCHEAIENETTVPFFIHSARSFSLPPQDKDIIMICAGTGLAPFRAFIQERQIQKATGKNWLFFGERNEKEDFYFKDELLQMQKSGFLRLDTAFSRDGTKKVYVQHRLLEHAGEIHEWLQNGASIYICGNASKMAKDVHNALLTVCQNEPDPQTYLKKLVREKRYLKDIY